MCALFSQKKVQNFFQKNVFFKENMILVGSWKVELDFRVLAPTSISRSAPKSRLGPRENADSVHAKVRTRSTQKC